MQSLLDAVRFKLHVRERGELNATRQWACRGSQTISLFRIAIPKAKGWSHESFIRSFEFSAGQLQHTWLQQARLLIEKCVTACKLFYSSL